MPALWWYFSRDIMQANKMCQLQLIGKTKTKSKLEVKTVTLQYSQHCCSPQIAFPRWLTPEQMLLVKVLAAMHWVPTLFFFHLNWSVSSQIAYPRKLISWLGEINHGVTLFQTRVLFANLLSVMPAKPRLWLPSLSMCWFWSCFSL